MTIFCIWKKKKYVRSQSRQQDSSGSCSRLARERDKGAFPLPRFAVSREPLPPSAGPAQSSTPTNQQPTHPTTNQPTFAPQAVSYFPPGLIPIQFTPPACLKALAGEAPALPGDANFPISVIYPQPSSPAEKKDFGKCLAHNSTKPSPEPSPQP